MRIVKIGILSSVSALLALFLLYALPQVDVVRAVGVETKRMDYIEGTSAGKTRDVYFIQTEDLESKKPHVYRNEDHALYLKFDSADLQAQVQSFASDKAVIAVRHYGWRVQFLSMFPNAIKVWQVEPDYRHFPLLNILILSSLAGLFGCVYLRLRKKTSNAVEDVRVAPASEKNPKPKTKAEQDLDAFLSSDD